MTDFNAFHTQHAAESAVRRSAGLAARTAAEHADFLMSHRWVIGGALDTEAILEGAARVAIEAGLVPSRWTHVNAARPEETALFECSRCGLVSKTMPAVCAGRGCTDTSARYGHDPLRSLKDGVQ